MIFSSFPRSHPPSLKDLRGTKPEKTHTAWKRLTFVSGLDQSEEREEGGGEEWGTKSPEVKAQQKQAGGRQMSTDMKRIARLIFPLIFLLICEVNGQRRTKPPKKRPTPSLPEPVEPTEFPPPLPPGPPSVFPDCPRECFCPPDFPSAIYCDNRNLRKVPLIPPRAQYVYLQNNFIDKISEVSFKNATGLRWISLDNNRIDSVGSQVLQKLDNLVFLYMEKNFLKEVPNNLPPNLEQLRLSRNRISKIPENVFSKLDHLLLLDLHHNQLDNRDFKKNTFKGLKNLMQLNLAHNRLSKMPPGVPKAIHQLFLDENQIDNIPINYFKDFSNLAFIRLNYNKLSDKGLPVNTFNITNLLVLHLAYNNLTSIPYISPKLEHLYMNDNSIEKINGTQICPTSLVSLHAASSDLENAPRLRYLRLDGNLLKPPIPLDLMLCFRLLQSVIY